MKSKRVRILKWSSFFFFSKKGCLSEKKKVTEFILHWQGLVFYTSELGAHKVISVVEKNSKSYSFQAWVTENATLIKREMIICNCICGHIEIIYSYFRKWELMIFVKQCFCANTFFQHLLFNQMLNKNVNDFIFQKSDVV